MYDLKAYDIFMQNVKDIESGIVPHIYFADVIESRKRSRTSRGLEINEGSSAYFMYPSVNDYAAMMGLPPSVFPPYEELMHPLEEASVDGNGAHTLPSWIDPDTFSLLSGDDKISHETPTGVVLPPPEPPQYVTIGSENTDNPELIQKHLMQRYKTMMSFPYEALLEIVDQPSRNFRDFYRDYNNSSSDIENGAAETFSSAVDRFGTIVASGIKVQMPSVYSSGIAAGAGAVAASRVLGG